MGVQNFWDSFKFGFLNGMLYNNPFFCNYSSWNCPMLNSSLFMYMTPTMQGSFYPLMQDSIPPMPSISANFDVKELFSVKDFHPVISTNMDIGDIFQRSNDTSSNSSINFTPVLNQSLTQSTPTFTSTTFTPVVSDNYTVRTNGGEKPSSTQPEPESKKAAKPDNSKKSENPESKRSTSNTSLKGKTWDKMSDSEMQQVYGNYNRDVTVLYKGTTADLNKYLKGKGKLEGQGEAFMAAQNKYGISAAFLVGIAMNESDKGKSKLARENNNVGGVRISGSYTFKTYPSVSACIDDMARFLKAGYVDNKLKPLTKLYQINAKYCPSCDPTDDKDLNALWARNVEFFTNEVERA